MMIGEAPREYYHHRSHLQDNNEDYSSDLNHPSIFYFLSDTVKQGPLEKNSKLTLSLDLIKEPSFHPPDNHE